MPIHDWTRVETGTFHAFHTLWIGELMKSLNAGLLPEGYYALAEQVTSRMQVDLLTLRGGLKPKGPAKSRPGGVAILEAPPHVQLTLRPDPKQRPRRSLRHGRHLVVRHVTGHQEVAVIEIVSPANKDRRGTVRELAEKVVHNLESGVQVLMLDLLPPGRHDPHGLHGAVWSHFDKKPFVSPAGKPLTLASYVWQVSDPVAYVQPVALGVKLIDMPLFLSPDRYVNVPLEPTYQSAYQGMPEFWRRVIEDEEGPALDRE